MSVVIREDCGVHDARITLLHLLRHARFHVKKIVSPDAAAHKTNQNEIVTLRRLRDTAGFLERKSRPHCLRLHPWVKPLGERQDRRNGTADISQKRSGALDSGSQGGITRIRMILLLGRITITVDQLAGTLSDRREVSCGTVSRLSTRD